MLIFLTASAGVVTCGGRHSYLTRCTCRQTDLSLHYFRTSSPTNSHFRIFVLSSPNNCLRRATRRTPRKRFLTPSLSIKDLPTGITMASTPTKSDFPKFLDGDVLILISTTQYYKLHSQVLSAHSSFFANEIATKPGPRLNAQARREHAATYRFEFQPSNKEGDFGQLVRAV